MNTRTTSPCESVWLSDPAVVRRAGRARQHHRHLSSINNTGREPTVTNRKFQPKKPSLLLEAALTLSLDVRAVFASLLITVSIGIASWSVTSLVAGPLARALLGRDL